MRGIKGSTRRRTVCLRGGDLQGCHVSTDSHDKGGRHATAQMQAQPHVGPTLNGAHSPHPHRRHDAQGMNERVPKGWHGLR